MSDPSLSSALSTDSNILGRSTKQTGPQSLLDGFPDPNTARATSTDCTIERHHNAVVPVFRLTEDVLFIIFSLLCDDNFPPRKIGWAVVSHVCQLWRYVAIRNSSLWGNIKFDGSESAWVRLLIKRSGAAPISLRRLPLSHALHPISDELRECLVAEVARMQSICTSDFATDEDLILALMTCKAPWLEHLVLVTSKLYSQYVTELPTALFSGDTPRLRHLEIQYCTFSWESLRIPTLKYLEIRNRSYGSVGPEWQSGTELLDCLSELKSLETLKLSYVIPHSPSVPTHERPVLQLLNLSTIELEDSYAASCSWLLGRLYTPALSRLSVTCGRQFSSSNRNIPTDDHKSMFPFIHRLLSSNRVYWVDIFGSHPEFDISAWSTSDVQSNGGSLNPPDLSLFGLPMHKPAVSIKLMRTDLEPTAVSSYIQSTLLDFWDLFSKSSPFQALSFQATRRISWLERTKYGAALTHICVFGYDPTLDLLHLLFSAESRDLNGSTVFRAFPKLESLTISLSVTRTPRREAFMFMTVDLRDSAEINKQGESRKELIRRLIQLFSRQNLDENDINTWIMTVPRAHVIFK
jgi:hypothetical protein